MTETTVGHSASELRCVTAREMSAFCVSMSLARLPRSFASIRFQMPKSNGLRSQLAAACFSTSNGKCFFCHVTTILAVCVGAPSSRCVELGHPLVPQHSHVVSARHFEARLHEHWAKNSLFQADRKAHHDARIVLSVHHNFKTLFVGV